MSAVWLKIVTFLCLSSTALSETGGGVVWKDKGGTITIQCKSPNTDQDNLSVRRGLTDDEILFKEKNSDKITISKEFEGRLQINGGILKMDILIKNLTSNDTGPYWCRYSKFNEQTRKSIKTEGQGSVLLVVKEAAPVCPCSTAPTDATKTSECDPARKDLVMVSILISAAVLLGIITGVSIWIIKTKTMPRPGKPTRISNNDVYEDMRGTIRR